MPRIQLSHDKLTRIGFALIADNVRRGELAGRGDQAALQSATIEENNAIIATINRVRAKDGLTPLPRR